MNWLSSQDTEDCIAEMTDTDSLLQVYALSLFVDEGFFSRSIEIPNGWHEAIVLSDLGVSLLTELRKAGLGTTPDLDYFTLFRLFFHTHLLIDYAKTDKDSVHALLQGMHSSTHAQWPYVYGRHLYDRFNDTYHGNRTQSIQAVEAERLLTGTPQGVFQVGRIVSGPLGFQESSESRIVPPTLSVALWHCSDPGCAARHVVRFEQHETAAEQTKKAFSRFIADRHGPPSEWRVAILRLANLDRWSHGRPYCDLAAVLADCIVGDDRCALCTRALGSPHYSRIVQVLRDTKGTSGNPREVCEALSAEEQHQVLLLLPDRDIIELIDDLVCVRTLRIPPSEIRMATTYQLSGGWDFGCKLSSLGIQSTNHPPTVEITGRVWKAYNSLEQTDDLTWRVREHAGETLEHRLHDYLRTHGPGAVVRELILPSRAISEEIGKQLDFQIREGEIEDVTVDRLLWKFGFTVPRYAEDYTLLRTRIAEFRDCLLTAPPELQEDDRAQIRGIGVNLFVSVEQFLEDLLVYNVWLMFSDHFLRTRFHFHRQAALREIGRRLGESILSGTEEFRWSPTGNNALGTLLSYLHAFLAWLKERSDSDPELLLRTRNDYPHYDNDDLWDFPFKHTAFWADADVEILHQYSQSIDSVLKQLAQADLCAVRNGLDHKRSEEGFPDPEKMIASATRLQQALEIADRTRLIPKFFWATSAEGDDNGNVTYTLQDYREAKVSLTRPTSVRGGQGISFGMPFLLAPFDFLNKPNSTLVFCLTEQSSYEEYWANYPRRRHIPHNADAAGITATDSTEDE